MITPELVAVRRLRLRRRLPARNEFREADSLVTSELDGSDLSSVLRALSSFCCAELQYTCESQGNTHGHTIVFAQRPTGRLPLIPFKIRTIFVIHCHPLSEAQYY
jgi:hypothetical protein